uniref:Putative site-specific tyrosine recombinase n=1 Tax=viral metagenome TaxID=1070528 RepID=A0A6H2A056_9ZZZZ
MTLSGLDQFISQFDSFETKRAYRRDIIQFFAYMKKSPVSINRIDVMAYVDALKKSFSASTVNRLLSSVKSYMKFLLFNDIISKNPFEGMRRPKIQRAMKEDVNDKDLQKMINQIKNPLEMSVMYLMLYNGLRRSEVCRLDLSSIKNTKDGIAIEFIGKGNKLRMIPLHPECQKAIHEYLKSQGRFVKDKKEPLFINNEGVRLDVQVVYRIVKRLMRKARIKMNVHPHMLRAKFVSMALESGVPITSVQADLGHSSIETTAMYDHAKNQFNRSSVLKIKKIEIDNDKTKKGK